MQDPSADLRDFFLKATLRPGGGRRTVAARSLNQKRYIEAIERNDVVFGIGPAGTGKTYLAMAQAVSYLLAKRVTRIILARPAVEAGEKLGFLPGDLQEKVNPYLRPLYDALYDMMETERAERLVDRGTIEIAPLALCAPHAERRVRHPRRSAEHQLRADEDVPDPPRVRVEGRHHGRHHADRSAVGQVSGLIEATKVVGQVDGIEFVYFDERDVVRHRVVQQIVKAYDAYTAAGGGARRPGSGS